MFGNQVNESKSVSNEKLVENILKSELKVTVSSINGSENTSIKEILDKAKKSNKTVVFTFTPGPFKSAQELPIDWMKTDPAIGCTAQLCAFQKAKGPQANQNQPTTRLDEAIVYAINKHNVSYQVGKEGLLAIKKLNDLFMLSDENGELENAFGLATISVNGKKYLERFSIAIKPNGAAQIFTLSSPVNDVKAAEHVEGVSRFITLSFEKNIENSPGVSAVKSGL